jgi:hypothetical protein
VPNSPFCPNPPIKTLPNFLKIQLYLIKTLLNLFVKLHI